MKLAKVVEKYKKQCDEEVEKNHDEKTKCNYRRKRHVAVKPECFYSKAVREFYTDMKDVPTDHPDFQWAIKVLAFGNIANLRGPPWRPVKKAHASGGGIKTQSSGNSFCIIFFLVC